jgi:hypothetical protein
MKNTRLGQTVTSNDATNGPLTAVSPADHMARMPGRFTAPALWALLIRDARCSDGGLDPDQWYPVSADPGRARQEAAAAIAICTTCPVRGHCLTLSLRHWDIGQHGVWGGLVAADRARLRRGVPVGQALDAAKGYHPGSGPVPAQMRARRSPAKNGIQAADDGIRPATVDPAPICAPIP